jgi:Polysaccharide lyase
MNGTPMHSIESKNGPLSLVAFILFLFGSLLPMACWAFWLPEPLLLTACGAEALAFLLGIGTWRPAKIAVIGSIIFALLGVWLSWAGLPTYQLTIRPAANWMKPLGKDWILESPGKPYSIQTVSDLKENGDDSLRFEIRGHERWVDQTFNVSYRSEVETTGLPPANSVRWYAFSVFFPTNFPLEKNRLVFAQWHDEWHLIQPGRSPSLAFRFVKGRLSITLRHSARHLIYNPDSVPDETLFKKNNFKLGQWHDFVVQAKWSFKDDGFINVWWNDKQIVQYRGPVGYNEDVGPYFKFGLYRDDTEKTYVAYFNHVKIGGNPKDVDFDSSTATRY